MNASNRSSISPDGICPCAVTMRALGQRRRRRFSIRGNISMRLHTANICPLRSISKSIASLIRSSSSRVISSVCTGYLFCGGVVMMLRSRAPRSENCKVRGIGVAVSVSTSMFARILLSRSLTATPNFCSSSMISSPKSCHLMFLLTILCVPMRMSICPLANCSNISLVSLAVFLLLRYAILAGVFAIRSRKVL